MTEMQDQSGEVQRLRGVVAIILALFLLVAPGMTVATGAITLVMFVILFGIFALIEGVSAIVVSLTRREGSWLLTLLFGAVCVLAGLEALRHPISFGAVTALVVIYIIVFKAVVGGILETVSAVQYRDEANNVLLQIINGVLSLVFGLLLLGLGGFVQDSPEHLIRITAYYLLLSGAIQFLLSRGGRSQ